jgi:DNA-directed RNA polymerase specialized sigma24 family protein
MLYSFDYHDTEINVPPEAMPSIPRVKAYADTDEQLMQRIQQGDEAALGILLYRHIGACRNLAKRVVPNESESETLVHEVFAEVAQEAGRYSAESGPVLGWILTLVRRRSIDRLRGTPPQRPARPAKRQTVPAVTEAPGEREMAA